MTEYHKTNRGFTLVELLVVVAIIGVLMGLLLPGVQACREAARRTTCSNNLKNQVLGLLEYHGAHGKFPPGRSSLDGTEHSWYSRTLPFLEQAPIYHQIDFQRRWDDPLSNARVTQIALAVVRCPSAIEEFPGDTDYAGVMGSSLTGLGWEGAFRGGVLFKIEPLGPSYTCLAAITDGASNTICIAESADRSAEDHGSWADGLHIVTHSNGPINLEPGSIYSRHPAGAFAARADGGVIFLSNSTDQYIVGALCTKNGKELFSQADILD